MRLLLLTLALSGPWTLTAVPSVGTVTWRCDHGSYGLGFRAFADSATDELTFRAGRLVRHRTVQPGQSVRFPVLHTARQHLTLLQGIEPGTLRAEIDVDFSPRPVSPSHCFSYLPPAVTMEVFPR